MKHFKSDRGGKSATEQADEFVSQENGKNLFVMLVMTTLVSFVLFPSLCSIMD